MAFKKAQFLKWPEYSSKFNSHNSLIFKSAQNSIFKMAQFQNDPKKLKIQNILILNQNGDLTRIDFLMDRWKRYLTET